MTADLRHLLVYLCAALLSVAPGLAWGEREADNCSSLVKNRKFVAANLICKPLAEWGSANAQFNLAVMYHEVGGMKQNKEKAAMWFRVAAQQGHSDALDMLITLAKQESDYAHYAQFELGKIYHEGKGIIGDPQEAYIWLLLAAYGGNKEAHDLKKEVKEYLSIDQIHTAMKEAKRRDDGWLPAIIKFIVIVALFLATVWLLIKLLRVQYRRRIAPYENKTETAANSGKIPLWKHFFGILLGAEPNDSWHWMKRFFFAYKQPLTIAAVFIPASVLIGLGISFFIGIGLTQAFTFMAATLGPFLAVIFSIGNYERQLKQQRRIRLFNTLVSLKKYDFSLERTQALNEVKIEFNEDNDVVEAWNEFVDYMEQPEQARKQTKEEEDLYDALLKSMARALGDESKDISRSFAPQAHRNLEKLDVNWKTSLLKVLTGEEPIATRDSKREKAEALYIQGVRHLGVGDGVSPNPKKAVRLLREASALNHANAKNALGKIYFYGEGAKKDEKKAFSLFKEASEYGNIAEAQNHLGVMYAQGRFVNQDLIKAERFFLRATEKGLPIAQYNLMLMYIKEESAEESDSNKVREMLETTAHEGFADAQYLLGLIEERIADPQHLNAEMKREEYLPCATVEESSETTKVLIERGAANDRNYPSTPQNIIQEILMGMSFPGVREISDFNKEITALIATGPSRWYGQAAQQGHDKARKKIKDLAKKGNATAQYYLGAMYLHGSGVEKKLTKAYFWFSLAEDSGRKMFQGGADKKAGEKMNYGQIERAKREAEQWRENKAAELKALQADAEKGVPTKQYKLGVMHLNGERVEKNIEEAAKFIKLSAEGGYAVAQNIVGRELLKAVKFMKSASRRQGNDKIKDILSLTMRRIKEANNEPDVRIENDLGIMLLEGIDLEKSEKEAADWLEDAAYQDIPEAQYNLGQMHRKGNGFDKSDIDKLLSEAYIWLWIAIRGGHKKALKDKDGLEKNMKQSLESGEFADIIKKAKKRAQDIKRRKQHEKEAWGGDINAQYELGWMYRKGDGFSKKDINKLLSEAYIWFWIAEHGGHNKARKDKDSIERDLEQNLKHEELASITTKAEERAQNIERKKRLRRSVSRNNNFRSKRRP